MIASNKFIFVRYSIADSMCVSWAIVAIAVVVALLQGPLSDNEGIAEQGLKAIRYLATRTDNSNLLESAGASKGE